MVLESTMLLLDNSEFMRNGDYPPCRLSAQHDAANLLTGNKTQSNPENTVGVLSMASSHGSSASVLTSPTDDVGSILKSIHEITYERKTSVTVGMQIAQLALKHRRNKNGGQRLILFVGSPIEESEKDLVKAGKLLKKNNVAIDIIEMGEHEGN